VFLECRCYSPRHPPTAVIPAQAGTHVCIYEFIVSTHRCGPPQCHVGNEQVEVYVGPDLRRDDRRRECAPPNLTISALTVLGLIPAPKTREILLIFGLMRVALPMRNMSAGV
jgi:hypothetical protein